MVQTKQPVRSRGLLDLELGYEEAFEKAWAERVTREGPTPGSSAATSDSAKMHFDQKADEQAPPEDAQPRGQRAAKRPPNPEKTGSGPPAREDDEDGPKEKSLLARANAMKAKFTAVTSGAASVLNSIAKHPAWSWVKAVSSEDLRSAKARLDEALAAAPFNMDYMSLPLGAVTKKWGAKGLGQHVAVFCKALDEPLQCVARETSQLIAMHTTRKS